MTKSRVDSDYWLGHKIERLREVFDLVKTPGNWKDPIDVKVPVSLATYMEISNAVSYFCGGQAMIEQVGDQWHVTDEGYYHWIGA
jgi:hypothetical protein